jgi:hypothetical protein
MSSAAIRIAQRECVEDLTARHRVTVAGKDGPEKRASSEVEGRAIGLACAEAKAKIGLGDADGRRRVRIFEEADGLLPKTLQWALAETAQRLKAAETVEQSFVGSAVRFVCDTVPAAVAGWLQGSETVVAQK